MRCAVVLAFAAAAFAQEAVPAETVPVAKEWSGGRTEITAAEYHRVLDADAWTRLWQRHTGRTERAPEVDFERTMVVACFLGPVAHDRVSLYAAKRTKDELVLGLLLEEDDCCDFSKQPQYYMAVVPREARKLTVISRVRQELDVDPRQDRLLHEFAALGE